MTPAPSSATGGLPPLVEPGPQLPPERVRRHSRHLLLPGLGEQGQRRLAAARVLVVGAGGLGSPVVQYLAAAGVGTIGIVDDDRVEESNLQRQVLHGVRDLGRPKVDSAADAVAAIDPDVRVERHAARFDVTTALDLVRGYHLVIDGADNFPTRYLVGDACTVAGVPWVWGSVFRFDGQVSVFWAEPPPAADGTRRAGVTYRDLHPLPPPPGSVPSCAEGGVLGAVCGIVGSVMATEAVKLICGLGDPLLGRVLVLDSLTMAWRPVPVRAAPGVARPTSLATPEAATCAPAGPATDPVPVIGARDLARLLAERDRGGPDLLLVDVREPAERAICVVPGAESVPLADLVGDPAAVLRRAADRPVVLYCRSGVRSAEAARHLRAAGGDDVRHLDGGVLAWVAEVDPTQPTY